MDVATPTEPGGQELRYSWRQARAEVVRGSLLIAMVTVCFISVSWGDDGPIDYRSVAFFVTVMVALFLGAGAASAAVKLLRRTRVQHTEATRWVAGVPAVIAICLVFGVPLAVVGVQVVRRGVILPWQALASTYPTSVCVALEQAGLDGVWPRVEREQYAESSLMERNGHMLSCGWDPATGHGDDAPVDRLDATILVASGDLIASPIGNAAQLFRLDRNHTEAPTVSLAGIGDEAYISRSTNLTQAGTRVANVTVLMRLYGVHVGLANGAVERLLRGIVAQIRVG